MLFTYRTLLSVPALVLLTACSVQKRIDRSAKGDLLKTDVLKTAHVGISIYDADAGRFIYNYQGDKYFVPASNIKLPTCYAAMKYLGDSLPALLYRLDNNEEITIAGTGDPGFLLSEFPQQPVFDFLKRFKRIKVQNRGYTDFLGNGWSWNDYLDAYMAQRSALPVYGNLARFSLTPAGALHVMPGYFRAGTVIENELSTGLSVSKAWDKNNFIVKDGKDKLTEVPFVPDEETLLRLLADTLKTEVLAAADASVKDFTLLRARPVDSVLKPMMYRSDNFFAEQMLMMVSQQKLGRMSDAAIIDDLLATDLADLPQKPRWVDGSGLSRYNLFSPQDFVAILGKMQREFGMNRIKGILPTGGQGTISSYYRENSGRVYAKTGTLSGVVSLSGFFYTARGRLLIFSVLVNNHNGQATEVRRAVEKFLQGLARKN